MLIYSLASNYADFFRKLAELSKNIYQQIGRIKTLDCRARPNKKDVN